MRPQAGRGEAEFAARAAGIRYAPPMTTTDTPVTGRCLCGDVRYQFTGAPVKVLHCHCDSCRRHA